MIERCTAIMALLLTAGCASRPQPASPYVPPEAMYSGGSTVAAVGGLMATAVGAELSDRRYHSTGTRKVGNALMAAGAGLMAAAVADAIEVEKERQKFYKITYAFWNRYVGSPPAPDSAFRPAPPPLPEPPFRFDEPESPLSGKRGAP